MRSSAPREPDKLASQLDPETQRALRLSVVDGCLHAIMLGVSESYFAACALSLGHSNTALAVLLTLPLFAGATSQALTGPLVLLLGSRKRLVVLGAALQALSHLGLIAVAWFGVSSLWPLLALVTLYYVSGMGIVPAWGAWMGTLTEHVDRQRYFALRSAALSAGLLGGFLWGGYHLRDGAAAHALQPAYAALFLVGFVVRSLSTTTLALQIDPAPPVRDSMLRVLARTRRALRGEGLPLALGIAVFMLGAQLSIPFYAPFMLKTLAFSYDRYALMCAVQLAVKSIAFSQTHKIAARVGLERQLIASILGLSCVGFLWGGMSSTAGFVVAQILSGIAWASYEFASFQLLLRSARVRFRIEFLAVAASLSGLLQLCGALCGSFLLASLHFSYPQVFISSGVARLLPLLVLAPLLSKQRLHHRVAPAIATATTGPGATPSQAPLAGP